MDKEDLDRDWVKKEFRDKLKKLMKPEIVKGGEEIAKEHPEWGQHEDPPLKPPEIPSEPKKFELTRTTIAKAAEEVSKPSTDSNIEMKKNFFIKENSDFVTEGPNPLRIPEADFKNILDGYTNMYLAHEISVNKDFQLQQHVLPPDSLEGRVKDMMLKAYWDIFDQNTSREKPNYEMAIQVFEEIREKMLALLLPHNHSIRARIQEVLDMDLIQQQVGKDCVDFSSYMSFVIETLGQLCCPSRDEEIKAIKILTKPSDIFKAILNTIDNMNLDMANYHIYQVRPAIRRHCIEYEQRKFADFLQWQYINKIDGLAATRAWLLRHKNSVRDARSVLGKAYAKAIFSFGGQFDWPETLVLDYKRFSELCCEAVRLSIIGASLLQSGIHYQPLFPTPCLDLTNKLRQMAFKFLNLEDSKDPIKVKDCLESIAEQSILIINKHLANGNLKPLNEQQKNGLRIGITQPGDPDNKIRLLILRRFIGFAEDMTVRVGTTHVPIPPGLNVVQLNAMEIVGHLQRLTSYNQAVFQDLYFDIIEGRCVSPTFETLPEIEPAFLSVLNALRVPMVTQTELERIEFLQAQEDSDNEEKEDTKEDRYVKEGQQAFKLIDPAENDIQECKTTVAKTFLEDLSKSKKLVEVEDKLSAEAKKRGIEMTQSKIDEENPFFKMLNTIEKCKESMKVPVNFIPIKTLIKMNEEEKIKQQEEMDLRAKAEKENEVGESRKDSENGNSKKSSLKGGIEESTMINEKKLSLRSDVQRNISMSTFQVSALGIRDEAKSKSPKPSSPVKEQDTEDLKENAESNDDFPTYQEVKKAKYKNYSEIDEHFKLDFYEKAKLRGDKSGDDEEEDEEKKKEKKKSPKTAKSDTLGLTGKRRLRQILSKKSQFGFTNSQAAQARQSMSRNLVKPNAQSRSESQGKIEKSESKDDLIKIGLEGFCLSTSVMKMQPLFKSSTEEGKTIEKGCQLVSKPSEEKTEVIPKSKSFDFNEFDWDNLTEASNDDLQLNVFYPWRDERIGLHNEGRKSNFLDYSVVHQNDPEFNFDERFPRAYYDPLQANENVENLPGNWKESEKKVLPWDLSLARKVDSEVMYVENAEKERIKMYEQRLVKFETPTRFWKVSVLNDDNPGQDFDNTVLLSDIFPLTDADKKKRKKRKTSVKPPPTNSCKGVKISSEQKRAITEYIHMKQIEPKRSEAVRKFFYGDLDMKSTEKSIKDLMKREGPEEIKKKKKNFTKEGKFQSNLMMKSKLGSLNMFVWI